MLNLIFFNRTSAILPSLYNAAKIFSNRATTAEEPWFLKVSTEMQSYFEDAPLRSPNTSTKGKKRSFVLIDGNSEHDDNHQPMENPSKELVLYDPGVIDTGHDTSIVTGHMDNHTPMFRNFFSPNSSSCAFTTIGTFTIHCVLCFKWRIIPTKKKYEQIRERILDEHLVCEHAHE
ncbi:hypothetical protein Cni_G06839 [Canna indica]|uniref:CW-type domain-containing protein n=1 Tax=Canna indica TaxID=4628 RepID=A0AAQ3JZC0_9LILI|nr:hypothetical protein Cni_G06839 [Canna indica]